VTSNNDISSKILDLIVPAKAEYLSLVRVVVAAVAGSAGFGDEAIADIKVALSEASTNVIRHAYDGELSEDKRIIEISCCEDNGRLCIEIIDHGTGMPLTPPASEGLGLGIIGSLMDEVDVETGEGGTTVTLVKQVATPRH
jgi:serine/threonine-protein kinase RsbW